MDYLSAAQCARKWGIHLRAVQRSCQAGRIPGAVKLGNNWLIPSQAPNPQESGSGAAPIKEQVLFTAYPEFLSGRADDFLAGIQDATYLWAAQGILAYNRCAYRESIDYLSRVQSGQAHYFSSLLFRLYASICVGDFAAYRQMQSQLDNHRSCRTNSRELCLLLECLQTNINVSIGVVRNVPDWLVSGDLTSFPAPMRDLAWYAYVRYLQITKAYRVMLASTEARLSMARHPGFYTLSEIYLYLYAALGHLKLGRPEQARQRMLTAMHLALPDRFIGPFAETMTIMQGLTEQCLQEAFPQYFDPVVSHWKAIFPHWLKAYNEFAEHSIPTVLTKREHQVALYAADGLTNAQIAQHLYLSISTVKGDLSSIYDKLGISKRRELRNLF